MEHSIGADVDIWRGVNSSGIKQSRHGTIAIGHLPTAIGNRWSVRSVVSATRLTRLPIG